MPSVTNLFHAHGMFCASHPLEVLVTTVTVIMSLMSIATSTEYTGYGCSWNFLCAKKEVGGTVGLSLDMRNATRENWVRQRLA